jgi:hypothetical protein
MSHFAKVCDGKVLKVIVAEKEFFDTYIDDAPGEWIQTSYNTRNGIHYGQDGNPDDGVALRGNYAGIGYTYDRTNDVFYVPQPFNSWILNKTTWSWEAPTPYPASQRSFAAREAISRGTKLPNAGYRRSK